MTIDDPLRRRIWVEDMQQPDKALRQISWKYYGIYQTHFKLIWLVSLLPTSKQLFSSMYFYMFKLQMYISHVQLKQGQGESTIVIKSTFVILVSIMKSNNKICFEVLNFKVFFFNYQYGHFFWFILTTKSKNHILNMHLSKILEIQIYASRWHFFHKKILSNKGLKYIFNFQKHLLHIILLKFLTFSILICCVEYVTF
jgi:hypothetical protein